jgi:exopolysaccharide biosynthesis polyprenyl glycosylphosphotransferase
VVRRKERLFAERRLAADSATLVAAFVLAYLVAANLPSLGLGPMQPLRAYTRTLAITVLVFVAALASCGFYRSETYQKKSAIIGSAVKASFLGTLTMVGLLYLIGRLDPQRLALDAFVLGCIVVALAMEKAGVKSVLDRIAERRRRQGAWQVLIVAEGDGALTYLSLLEQHPHWGIAVAGVLDPSREVMLAVASSGGGGASRPVKAPPDWRQTLKQYVVDEVVAVVPWLEAGAFGELQEACVERGLTFRILVQMPEAQVGRYHIDDVGEGSYLISLESGPQDFVPLLLKRTMDIAGSLVGLAICGFVYLWYRSRIRRESPGPVLFSQKRVGQNGRLFDCYKFRTMYVGADKRQVEMLSKSKLGKAFIKLENDPRATPTGKWMRQVYLDEVPQFWNVLKGQMSLVGPRPSQPAEVSNYEHAHHRRLSMKPGITGLFQVGGHEAVTAFEDVVKLDCTYIDHWSLWLDFKIILQTFRKVLKGDGM